ncbi:GAF domain-containing protein [Chloroflexi bacterium TSY]|nr:GAF domain-containing protein [Chloroflexi bacterium TSY]
MVLRAIFPIQHLESSNIGVGRINIKSGEQIGISGRTVQSRLPQIVEDVTVDPDYVEYDSQTQSEIAVPIELDGQVIGVINLEHSRLQAFDREDSDVLMSIARQAAIAIRNAQLYEDIKRQAGALQALFNAGKVMTGSLDLDEILNRIAEQAYRLTGEHHEPASFADIALVYNGMLKFVTSYPSAELRRTHCELVDKIDLGDNHSERIGIAGRAIKQNAPQLVNDVTKSNDYLQSHSTTKSELAVPIQVNDQVIGAINVEHPDLEAFDVQDRLAFEALAAQAAIAIENARLFQQVTHKIAESNALNEVAVSLAGAVEFEDVLKLIMVAAVRFSDSHDGHIVLWDKDKREFTISLQLSETGELRQNQSLARQQGGYGRKIVDKRTTLVVEDMQKDPNANPGALRHGYRATMGVPLFSQNEVIGVLFVRSKKPRQISDSQRKLVETLASQAAVAIHRAYQYDILCRQSRHQQALFSASKVISTRIESGLEQLLDRILEQAVAQIKPAKGDMVHFGVFHLADGDNEVYVASVYPLDINSTLKLPRSSRYVLDRSKNKIGICGRTMLTKKPQRVGNVEADSDYIKSYTETRSQLSVPLLQDEQVLGVLTLESKERDSFDEADEIALQSLAELAVIAIRNAQQYQELRQTKGLVGSSTALAWMGMANNAWRHSIEGYAVNIRNAVTLIHKTVDVSETLQVKLDLIKKQVERILDRPITPPLTSEESVEPIDVNELISERLEQLWQDEEYPHVERTLCLDADTNLTVAASPEWLCRALDLLVDNAVQAMASSSIACLQITTRLNKDSAEILILDTGPGIPKYLHQRLFVERIEHKDMSKGLGIGLLMVQAIIQAYGGDIRIDRSDSSGTTMLISLPLVEPSL